jgi:hypothetical protein
MWREANKALGIGGLPIAKFCKGRLMGAGRLGKRLFSPGL